MGEEIQEQYYSLPSHEGGQIFFTEGLVTIYFIPFIKGNKTRKVMWKRICARDYS